MVSYLRLASTTGRIRIQFPKVYTKVVAQAVMPATGLNYGDVLGILVPGQGLVFRLQNAF